MARHGENIRKRKDGRWEGRYPVYSAEKGKQVYCSVYGRTYEEVRERLTMKKNLLKDRRQAREAKETESQHILEEIVFADTVQEWLERIKDKRKRSTYVKYSLIYRNHLEKNFGNVVLSEITDVYVRERIPNSLSNSVQSSIYSVLNQVLKFASAKYSVIIAGLKKPISEMGSKPIKVLARHEQKKLISVLYHEMDSFKMAVLFCLFTGLRLGEICALKWRDIDWEDQILIVSRTVQRISVEGCRTKTALMETQPKSEYSRREIPLPASMLELLMKFQSDNEYVFGSSRPMEPRSLQYHFKMILKEAGLQDTNFHILRHTFSTNCIEGGTDIKSLSEILGHADVQITLNRYVHPSMDVKRHYIDELSKFYGQIHGQVG